MTSGRPSARWADLDTPTIAEVAPLPARHERGEGWGEGCLDRLWMGSGREVRERNTKSQTPSSREIPSFKFQNLSQARCLGAWDLEFLWSLVFGALIGGRISPLPDLL